MDAEGVRLPSWATVVDDGVDFFGEQTLSLSQKLHTEVAASKSPHSRHSGMVDDDDDEDDGDNNAGKEKGMLVVLCSPMT